MIFQHLAQNGRVVTLQKSLYLQHFLTDMVHIFTEAVKWMSEEVRKKWLRCTPPFRNLEALATSEPQLNLCALWPGRDVPSGGGRT